MNELLQLLLILHHIGTKFMGYVYWMDKVLSSTEANASMDNTLAIPLILASEIMPLIAIVSNILA